MNVQFKNSVARATPIIALDRAAYQALAPQLPKRTQAWLATLGFSATPDSLALVPGEDGKLAQVFAGVAHAAHPFALSALPLALPEGEYSLSPEGLALQAETAALSWELGCYQFDLYKPRKRAPAQLLLKSSPDAQRGLAIATAMSAVRDLVNTPAEHMGPEELAKAAQLLAKQHGAKFKQVVGEELLKKNFPAIHAVGRASTRAPRLIELTWGNPKHPKLSLVGITGGSFIQMHSGTPESPKLVSKTGKVPVIVLVLALLLLSAPLRASAAAVAAVFELALLFVDV